MSVVRMKMKHENKTVEVSAGWDRPFVHYFGFIEDLDEELDGPEAYLYSTIFDIDAPEGGFDTLAEVKEKIEAVLGALPEGFWALARIQDTNVIRNYQQQGE